MSAKQKRKTKPKSSSEKATKTKSTRATRTKKKPGKEAPSAPVETRKPVEIKLERKKPLEAILVEHQKIVEPEVKPSIEIKAAEKKPEAVEVKPEPKKPEFKPVEAEAVIVETKPEPEKPMEVKKEVAEAKPEPRKPQPKPVVELKKPALAKPKPLPKKKLEPPKGGLLLIVRLRGTFAVPHHIERTLLSLRLVNKFNATLAKNSPSMIGMLRQVKDYVTWGGVEPTDVATLLKERGKVNGEIPLTNEFAKDMFAKDSIDSLATALATGEISLQSLWKKGVKPVFRLRPPSGGFKSTIKKSYTSTGQLGYRGSAIATLMTDMT
jgi:large subunit ribosomal protein L30